MKIDAKTADEYLAKVDDERRPQLARLRALVKRSVPKATESIQWGMIGWAYEGRPFAALASQKNHMSLYLMDLYTQPGLRQKHAKALARLRIGKSCITFDSIEELPLDTIAAVLREAPNVVVATGTLAAKRKKSKS